MLSPHDVTEDKMSPQQAARMGALMRLRVALQRLEIALTPSTEMDARTPPSPSRRVG